MPVDTVWVEDGRGGKGGVVNKAGRGEERRRKCWWTRYRPGCMYLQCDKTKSGRNDMVVRLEGKWVNSLFHPARVIGVMSLLLLVRG